MRVRSLDELPPPLRNQVAAAMAGQPQAASTATAPPAKASKYRNQRCTADGQAFDSKLEVRCYWWLKERVGRGEVLWFIRQVPFVLEGNVRYRADFLAVLATGGVEVIDAKGVLTKDSAIKLKQVKARYGVDVRLWKRA